ncbi:hypothetical protein [Nocardia goodfellowii]|uniref:Uncharacterized protein n=1 Tax=Nocardia goodfellowii TaxID=882446 RepID=A0ABS4QMJ7_9NOCA|nr:hypothetical protein [Nocardia goodfellowii]MBP2192930.1 hypothetical protein [Nocardia goodfellowii]
MNCSILGVYANFRSAGSAAVVALIEPLIPPQAPLQELLHGPAPTPHAVRIADPDVVYGMSTIGDGGRILDKLLTAELGWNPGLRLRIEADEHDLLIVWPCAEGSTVLSPSLHITWVWG